MKLLKSQINNFKKETGFDKVTVYNNHKNIVYNSDNTDFIHTFNYFLQSLQD